MQTAAQILYMIASALFIVGIKRMSAVNTARSANALSAIAMALAIVGALLDIGHNGPIGWPYIAAGVVVGGGVGAFLALRVTMDGFYPLYEYTSSPLTSGTHPPGEEAENPARLYGVFEKRNFGMLHFSGPRLDRQVVMECYDKDGGRLWQYEIKAKDLRVD